MLDNKYINPSVDFVASIDCKTGKLIKSEGRLTWLIKDENSRNGYGYDFEKYGIYKVLVRKVFRLNWTNINQKYGITDLC